MCVTPDFPFLCFGVIQLLLIELPLRASSGREETRPIIFVLSTVILSYSFLKSIISNSLPVSEQEWTKPSLNGELYINGLLDQSLESLGEQQSPSSWKPLKYARQPLH